MHAEDISNNICRQIILSKVPMENANLTKFISNSIRIKLSLIMRFNNLSDLK